jgi:hypothetical protein
MLENGSLAWPKLDAPDGSLAWPKLDAPDGSPA